MSDVYKKGAIVHCPRQAVIKDEVVEQDIEIDMSRQLVHGGQVSHNGYQDAAD